MEKPKKNITKNKRKNRIVDISRINDIHIELSKITPNLVIESLKKQFFEKEPRDYAIINNYLLYVSKLTDRFRSKRISQSLYEKMILLSLQSSRLKIFNEAKSQIYTPENEANHLYIILKGSVKIIKVQKTVTKMNSFDYFKMILNYRNKKKSYLLKNTINENNGIFPIDLKDVEILDKILLKIFIINRKETENDFDYLDIFFEKLGLNYSDFGLKTSYKEELRLKNEKIEIYNKQMIESGNGSKRKNLIPYNPIEAENNIMEQEKILHDKLNEITYDICQKYIYFLDNKEEFVTTFELNTDKILTSNECFGDHFGSKYIDFAESNEGDLYLLMIKNDIINQMADSERDKNSLSQVDFLVNNFFFRSIKKFIFERYFLNIFELENYQSGQKICEENSTVKYLYFIKKGKVKLSYNKSILEIHSLINLIKEQIKQKVFDKESNNNEIIKYLEENQNYYSVEGEIDSIKEELNNKQERIIIIYQENQCLGYECYYYGLKYLYTATAASDKVELYKISITQLAKIFNNRNEKCYIDLARKAEKSLFFLMKRFIKMNELLMNLSKKRKETQNEVEKNNQTIVVNKVSSHNFLRVKSMKIKSTEISKILPNILKYKMIRNPDTSKLFISNLSSQIMNRKLPTINANETSNQSSISIHCQSEYEKNILNNNNIQITDVEKNTNEQNYQRQIFRKKLNHQRKSQIFLTRTKSKISEFNSNISKEVSIINNTFINNSKFIRESNNNMSSIFLRQPNNIGESIIINENNISSFNRNKNMDIYANALNSERQLLGDKRQKLLKIKKSVMLKKNRIYHEQKNKLKAMVNIYKFDD